MFTLGLGTPEGELIQITDEKGQRSFLKDENGNTVKSRLNESLLRDMAREGKWFLHLDEGCQYTGYPLQKQSGTFAQVGIILQTDQTIH